VHVLATSPDSIALRWDVEDEGDSPVAKTVISFKMTYGEWSSVEVGWHRQEHTLGGLYCGREYHAYVVLVNAIGSSPTSDVLTVRTQGSRPTAPSTPEEFVRANATFLSLALSKWQEHACQILYFVVEYKLASDDVWTTVTNDLTPQPRYSVRGLAPDTEYDIKVTGHNHAGSTSAAYRARTTPEGGGLGGSGAAPFNVGAGEGGVGVRSAVLIVVSSLCLVLASMGVCICLRKTHTRPHLSGPLGYGEIPKNPVVAAGGVDNRLSQASTATNSSAGAHLLSGQHNLDHHHHQLYATIQRKQPPVPPFSTSKGFETSNSSSSAGSCSLRERPRRETSAATAHAGGLSHARPDLCPYNAAAFAGVNNVDQQQTVRCNTLGRIGRNLEMTEYQKQRLIEEADTVRIKVKVTVRIRKILFSNSTVQESKEYTLSLPRSNTRPAREGFSAAVGLDSDEDHDARNRIQQQQQQQQQQQPFTRVYRQQFNL